MDRKNNFAKKWKPNNESKLLFSKQTIERARSLVYSVMKNSFGCLGVFFQIYVVVVKGQLEQT